LDKTLQATETNALQLTRFANLLLVAAGEGGLIAIDISEPLNPVIISAGNTESVEAIDYYKDRLIAGGGAGGLRTFQAPAAFVVNSSVEHQAYLSEASPYQIQFNELISLESLQYDGIVQVKRSDTGQLLAFTINAIDSINGEATTFQLDFERQPQVNNEVTIDGAHNLRGSGQWLAFKQQFTQASSGSLAAQIHRIENGHYHQGQQQDIIIHGAHFRAQGKLYLGRNEIPFIWQDAQTLIISEGSLDLLELASGQHHLKYSDNELSVEFMGAIIVAEQMTQVDWHISPETADTQGGYLVKIEASKDVILPGSKVLLRSAQGIEITSLDSEDGFEIINLYDDVVDLNSFTFMLPEVFTAELYQVYLLQHGEEIFVGNFSYTLAKGRHIQLPNYPPHQIGAAKITGDYLFAGINKGASASEHNRFLMHSGFEIYDISIWDNPLRISQVKTQQPVNGIAIVDNAAYLASGSDGLISVDINNLSSPLVINKMPVPGYMATDVAHNPANDILALSVANDLGAGFIRFFDLSDDALNPPVNYTTINLTQGTANTTELYGQPVDIQWLNNVLYVLLKKEKQLYLLEFAHLPHNQDYSLHPIERGDISDINDLNASMQVQYGQINITTGSELVIIQKDQHQHYQSIYWESLSNPSAELINNGGGLFIADNEGLVDSNSPALVLSRVTPHNDSVLTRDQRIRFEFNQLLNTDPVDLLAAIEVRDSDANIMDLDDYSLNAVNTLSGAYIDIQFNDYQGAVAINLTERLSSVSGLSLDTAINEAMSFNYQLQSGSGLTIDRISRKNDVHPGAYFFHADGSETAIISGENFGIDKDALHISIGSTELSRQAIVSLSDTQMEITIPHLFLQNQSALLPLTISRGSLTDTLFGALVILPVIALQDFSPQSGPPEGGNTIDIYGQGFNYSTIIKFGQLMAGDINVLSDHHIQLRVPSGDFGYSTISAESLQFPGEQAIAPEDYFYAGKETASVNLPADKPSPVSAIHINEQVLYAVTGGQYDLFNSAGQIAKRLSSNVARLIITDVSDPVHPQIIQKQFATDVKDYHFDVTGGLSPDGFIDMVSSDNNLLLIGGSQLFHFDITLAADPELLNTINLGRTIRDIEVHQGLIYLSDSRGVHIYRLGMDRTLQHLHSIGTDVLSGTPNALSVVQDSLWIVMSNSRKVVQIELMSGHYQLKNSFASIDASGQRYKPEEILVRDSLVLISSGSSAMIHAYQLNDGSDAEQSATPMASLNMTYLVKNGDIYAGKMLLKGQTLYVVAGQGDLQLYDISPWLAGQFQKNIALQHYFSVAGDVTALAFHPKALYVGTAFAYANGEIVENPVSDINQANHLGGRVNTIINDRLVITEQQPQAESAWPADQAIEIQFNRILDYQQITQQADSLLTITQDGLPVAGFVSLQTNNYGSRLIFKALNPLLNNKRYRVTLSAAVRDIHGTSLGSDYSFRFTSVANQQPKITSVLPDYSSWRGGESIHIYGQNFTEYTQLYFADHVIDSQQINIISSSELSFTLPALLESPQKNLLVGIKLSNGRLLLKAPFVR